MSNEYRITYQDKIFVGDSVEDVVEKVKQYMEKGVEPVDTLKVESKKDSKRIYRIFSEMKSNLFELRYKAEQEWLTEREKNTLLRLSIYFDCRRASVQPE